MAGVSVLGPDQTDTPAPVVPSGPNISDLATANPSVLEAAMSAHGVGPYGKGSDAYGQGPYGQGPYGQGPYGQGPYGQGPYGQGPYTQGPCAQGPYGQGSYGLDPYGSVQGQGRFSLPVVSMLPGSPLPSGQGVGSVFGGVDSVWSRRPVASGSVFPHPQYAAGLGPWVSPSPVCSPVTHEVRSALTGGSLLLTATVTSVSVARSSVASCSLSTAPANVLSSPKPSTSVSVQDFVSAKRPAVSQPSGSTPSAKRPRK